jgi:hypothetical protein
MGCNTVSKQIITFTNSSGKTVIWNLVACVAGPPLLNTGQINTNTPVFCTASGNKSYRAYVAVIEALRACTPHFRHEQVIQRPGQPHVTPDDDEFIAEENLLLPEDYYKQPSEGASADDATVKHDNLPSEGASGYAASVSTSWLQLAGLSSSSPREPPSDQAPSRPPSDQADQPLLHPTANNLPQGPDYPSQFEPQASSHVAGVSFRGRSHTMNQAMAMADPIEQQGLFSQQGRDHTSFKADITRNQVADTLTKALSQNAFQKHRRAMCGQ